MTKKQLIKELRDIAKSYNIKSFFYKNFDDGGYCHLAKRQISIGLKKTSIQDIASTTFHEMAHILNKDNKKFKLYHSPRQWMRNMPTKGFLITAFRAELYTDKIGRELMFKHMPKIRYKKGYGSQYSRKWLKKYLTKSFGVNL